jgi:hypothetical protein
MRRLLLMMLFIMSFIPAITVAQQDSGLTINVTAHGNRVALKLDNETCRFGFPGLIDNPELVILGEDGSEFVRQPMGDGAWSMRDGVAYCEQTYEVSLPPSIDYTVQIPPYFTGDYSADEVRSGTLDIEVAREEGDPFPLPVRPAAGPIEGSDAYRLVGVLELKGEPWEQFINMPDCMGLGGYEDIRPGTRITVKDQSGTIVAVTELAPDPLSEDFDECSFQFVAEVPEAEFYTISMRRRGDITFSFDELEQADWSVELSLD